MATRNLSSEVHKFSTGRMLVTLGIIFGDIGTSPIYVLSAIIGDSVVSHDLILGSLSCVFWTLMTITTVKYVYFALNADNKGEGGIFSLYALVRRYRVKWTVFPAIVGCAMLIADGFITPAISISSAVEGLNHINPDIATAPIVVIIIFGIFLFQQFGTTVIGRVFGPIMILWFIMIAALGLKEIILRPDILYALNPAHAFNLIANHPGGFWLLGAVFLCTTGAEALYSDLGHCGKANIRVSWVFVGFALLLNYFGQGAHLLTYEGTLWNEDVTPFYHLMPHWFLPVGILITTCATIIASQALITGCFSLVNQAMKLKLWPNVKVLYPSLHYEQIYIPAINWVLLIGCLSVVWIFQKSSNMEAAYGLAIIINMIITSCLIIVLMWSKKKSILFLILFGVIFISIESMFLLSNIIKFTHGGWFTLLIATGIFFVMFIFYKARELRRKYTRFVPIQDYVAPLEELILDESIPKESTNLVFMCFADNKINIDYSIIYSIFKKRPKRADIYWFVHVNIDDEPFGASYSVNTIIPNKCFFVKISFGFKVDNKVNLMFRQIIEEMIKNKELDAFSHYKSLRKYNFPADFKFIVTKSHISIDNALSPFDQLMVKGYRIIEAASLSTAENFGLELSNLEEELIPIRITIDSHIDLKRKDE